VRGYCNGGIPEQGQGRKLIYRGRCAYLCTQKVNSSKWGYPTTPVRNDAGQRLAYSLNSPQSLMTMSALVLPD
jgi:hypothetical protein